LWYINIYK